MNAIITKQGLESYEEVNKILIRRASYKALLGQIRQNMRRVLAHYDSSSIRLDVYFDGEITTQDEEAVLGMQQRMERSFVIPVKVTYQCIRYDFPQVIGDYEGIVLYSRQEY